MFQSFNDYFLIPVYCPPLIRVYPLKSAARADFIEKLTKSSFFVNLILQEALNMKLTKKQKAKLKK